MSDPFADYTIKRITGEICRIRDSLCTHNDIKDNSQAVAAIIDVCDQAKDNIQRPWSDRTMKASNGRSV